MSVRIKWFVHHHYLAIVALTLLIVVILTSILYANGADWKVLLAVIGGLLSFVYFIQKQQLDEAKLFKELFVEFNEKYNGMNEKLNEIIAQVNAEKPLEQIDGAIDTLFDYFNLCSEEYLFYSLPYTFFLLNVDMELNKNGQVFVKKCSRSLKPN